MTISTKQTLNRGGTVIAKIFLNIFFIALSVFSIYPVIWMIYSSLKTDSEFFNDVISLPANPQFQNYPKAIARGKIDVYFQNSIYVSVICVILIVFLSFIVAYFINRFRFRGRRFLFFLFMAGMMIPIHGFLVPLYIQFSKLGLTNHWFTLLLPLTAFNMPLSLILFENFMKSVPMEIEESALIDGATLGQRILYIVFPMCLPILATLLILNFLYTWNEYPFALTLITSDHLKTLPLGISNFKGERSTDYPQMFAALTLVSLPVIAIYSIFSNKIMQGMTAGAIKG